jgi:hypothetical protein
MHHAWEGIARGRSGHWMTLLYDSCGERNASESILERLRGMAGQGRGMAWECLGYIGGMAWECLE